ncbi:hypothetical protein OXX80_008968 [Metschnikowia pulcherrima]
MGLVYMKLGDDHKAIQVLHDALALSPSDPVAHDLLRRALQTNKNSPLFLNHMDTKISEIHISSRKFRSPDSDKPRTNILSDTSSSANRLATPLNRKVRDFSESSLKSKFANHTGVDAMVETLKRGEDSSDEEVMDIESD